MKKERSNHGFGLAVFGIVLLAAAFVTINFSSNTLIASIIAFLSAIMSTAAYFEARRANGPRTFALTIFILTILGTFIILIWTGNIRHFTGKDDGTLIIEKQEESVTPTGDQAKKMKEMEKVIEELESDTANMAVDTIRK